MAKSGTTSKPKGKSELAALATLLGVMSTAQRLSEQLMQLSDEAIGKSVDALMESAGFRIEDLEDHLHARLKREGRKRHARTQKRKAA
jgi:hypothetical protein